LKRVLWTRQAGSADPLAAALREAGFELVDVPLYRVAPPLDPGPLTAAIRRLRDGEYDWVVFTSARAVDAVLARGGEALAAARVASVGPATSARLQEAGFRPDLVPDAANAAALAAALAARLRGGERILFPRADNAGPAVKAVLTAAGAEVDDPVAYRTESDPEAPQRLAAALAAGADAVVFASGEAVARYLAAGGPRDLPAVCIGPVTAAAAQAAGFGRVRAASAPTAAALAACLKGGVEA
jgi:uroporphyrinogen-III synthase